MIYDLLPEVEVFCTQRGGAISKIVANLMRFDDSRLAVCSAASDSWGFEKDRALVLPELSTYEKIRGTRYLPAWVKGIFYRRVYRPLLSRLKAGDIVWCHNQPYIAQALESSIDAAGAKLVYHSHDRHITNTAVSAFEAITPEAWVFVSEALRQRYLARFPLLQNTRVIHNGADESLYYPDPAAGTPDSDVPVILYVGRLNEEKGPHVLVEALRLLQGRQVKAFCKLIGSAFAAGAKPTAYVKSLYKASPPNVEYLGYRAPAQAAPEFRAADIVCVPSICEEGFGSVNIEAMACGVPVVATRIGGIPEIATEGGIVLVEPNSPEQLADALQKLIEDGDLRAATGAQGLASFQRRFTWAAIAEQHRELVASL
jgi:spore coat protein SA